MVSSSVRLGEELAGLALDFEPRVLVGLGPCVRGDPLHEIEQAGGRIAFFGDHRLDDLRGVGLGEAVLAQEGVAVLVGACDDATARRLDAFDYTNGRKIGRESGRERTVPYVSITVVALI